MLLGSIVEGALSAVFQLLLTVFFYGTARVLLPPHTLGGVRVEAKADDEALRFGWLGFVRDGNGRLVVGATLAAFVGLLLWVGVVAAFCFLLG